MNPRTLASVTLLLLAGCSLFTEPAPRLAVQTDEDRYGIGEAGTVSITNLTPDTVRHPGIACTTLQRRIEGRWEFIDNLDGGNCSPSLVDPYHVPIAPRDTEVGEFLIDERFETEAEYRWLVSVRRGTREGSQASNSFIVEE